MVRETRYLWVGNLPHTIREERILEHFKRYGKVQSVKILPKKEEESGSCATVAFIDIKSASKAHNADNKIEDRTLKTDYYEPPASSTASSAIYIHERDDALVRPAQTPYTAGRTPRYGLAEERNYERPGHYYNDREPYLRRPLNISYHDEDNYQGRAKSRDRYPRTPGNNYTEGTERPQNHFRTHNSRQHFEQSRYPVSDQYNEEREPTNTTPRLNRRTNNNPATPTVASIASPNTIRTENRLRRTKRRSPSRTPSGSRSNSGSRSRSHSSSASRSSSSSSKLRSSSSDSSGRSRSPSKSRSPVTASYGNQNNAKGSRLERPSSAIANPSSSVSYIPSTVNTSSVNCVSNNSPSQNCTVLAIENHSDKEEKRPQGICVRNLPVRSTDTSLKDGLFHEYKKHGKVTMVKVIGQGLDRYAVVCFKKPEDVDKALEVSKDKLFFGCKIEVTAHEGLDAEDNEFRPLEAELDEFHPKATRTLFIGNLEKDITTPDLRKHFDQFGEIIEIDIKKQGSASSYAFIQYSDIGSVVKAMRKLDGENLGANRIKLGFGKSMPTNCVWLDGIVESVSDKFLSRHFSRFGIVVYTVIDREKGHALVFYENVEFAQIAVSEMRGRILQGKKLQVDFASRECQTTFFDKLEMSGQCIPGDGTRPWEQQRRERRGGPEFEGIRNDEREQRVGFENRPYPRYEGPPRPPRGNFRGGQRTGFSSRGRGQGFSARYEVYHDEFGERRHRYNSREELVPEVTMFDSKIERPKYGEGNDISNRKRNKLRNSVSDQESHHSQSPPRSCHQSRSTSPVSKERKSFKDRLHHRIKSPGSHNSSLVNSPCRDASLEEVETNSDYRDSRCKSDIKMDDSLADLSFSSPRSSSEKECSDKIPLKGDCDSLRSRSSLDGDSADEFCVTNDQLGQIERKKRLLASSNFKSGKDLTLLVSKSLLERTKLKPPNSLLNSLKSSKLNCVSDPLDDNKCDSEDFSVQNDCVKDKFHLSDSMKKYDKKSTDMLSLFEQVSAHFETNDFDIFPGSDRLSRRKHRSPSSCSETNFENDVKSLTKEDCGVKLCKSGMKEPSVYNKTKSKLDVVDDNNCVSNSLDSFVFRKHLDPRKNFDPQSVNSLTNCRRISVDSDSCLPNAQTANEPFLCAVSTADISWKKQCNSISNLHFSENENSYIHSKLKDEIVSDEEILNNKKYHIHNSSPLYSPKPFLRAFSDTTHCNDIKRERDISPLSLPLPKFAASLRSPKASPSVLTSPKTNTAHSPRAGLSPSSASNKTLRYSEFLSDIHHEKKNKCYVPDEKTNNSVALLADSISAHESHDSTELLSNLESIQSPKTNSEKLKELHSSSESDLSPSASPSRPSIEDRIKALDEKFNAWSGSTRPTPAAVPETLPISVVDNSHFAVKRSRFNSLSDVVPEPSDIMKSLLARPTIVDQDCKRLQHIDEKYEPLNIKMDTVPKVKPTFRTKAAAKEFSTPIIPPAPNFNQPQPICKNTATVLVAQGIMSPPNTPIGAASSILSPVTPPVQQLSSQISTPVYTPCSPCSSFNVSTPTSKMIETFNTNFEKDICDNSLKSASNVFTSAKAKTDPNFHTNSTMLATSLKSPLHCPMEIPAHSMILNSPPNIKKEPASPTDSVTEAVCKIDGDIKYVKKEIHKPPSIQSKRENITFTAKENSHYNSFDLDKKEFCDSKDPRLSFHEDATQWREVGCKDEIKGNVDSCAKSFISTPDSDNLIKPLYPAVKKRVSSIDSTESESSKSVKSFESSRDSHDLNWVKHDKSSEPEPKKPKLSKCVRERSCSPPMLHTNTKKVEKKEKCSKTEKSKSSKSSTSSNPERSKSDSRHKSDSKDKSRSDAKFKDEKRSKSKDSKETSVKSESKDTKDAHTKNEVKSKSKERRNSEKDNKHVSSNSSINNGKTKKESSSSSNKTEKKDSEKSEKKDTDKMCEKGHEKKKCDEKEKKSSSKSKKLENQLAFDFHAFMDDEPVYFSMYDKVKARSSKTQTLKHQTNDLESVRQKFSKLKQRRAKRDEKSKSIDQDSDRDSDSCSQHSSESDSQVRSSKMKQARKRKLVIESSSDDNAAHHDSSTTMKMDKDLSDSDTDSEFDYNVSHRQSMSMKSRKKKSEIFNSDSSDSESNYLEKSHTSSKKKSSQNRNKSRPEKSRKSVKSDNDHSESDYHSKSKEKEKPKKVKRDKSQEIKQETDTDLEIQKKASDDVKIYKKKSSKEHKQELEISTTQKKLKSEHVTKEKHNVVKEKKNEPPIEKMHIDDVEKQKPYSKKRKKSKKMSKNREKRNFGDKSFHDSARNMEECDSKLSLPVLSPKPSNQLSEKQNSPPCLQVGILSDNDYKSDFSDYDFETQHDDEMDVHSDAWNKKEGKSDSSSEKSSKSKKKDLVHEPPPSIQSPEQDCSLPSFFDKLSDITDSETGKDPTDCPSDVPSDGPKHNFSVKKEKETFSCSTPHKNKQDKHENQMNSGDYIKHFDSHHSKEEKRKKKSKKQSKERKRKSQEKVKEEVVAATLEIKHCSTPVLSPKLPFEAFPIDDDSRLSDIRLDEEIAEEARRLEEELLAVSEETNTFGDEGPSKKEEKLLERRFEEEAAKETRRLEEELFSTGRDSWHMKEKDYDSEVNSCDLNEDKHVSEIDSLDVKEDNLFTGLDLHSSIAEPSQTEVDTFLSGQTEADPYKIDDKDMSNEIEDQRKIEDDLAVSALLQEMHCGEISAPELTKETDYLDPLIETHPEDTMNYLLPDDGENSLHIADGSPDVPESDIQEDKLGSPVMMLSPSSNSEPPALEISTIEEPSALKIDVPENDVSEPVKLESVKRDENSFEIRNSPCYEFENNLGICETKPPVISIPEIPDTTEPNNDFVSPRIERCKSSKIKEPEKSFILPEKLDTNNYSDNKNDFKDNQLTHFEDITMDITDKDDDNPPVLLPVESPPNLIPVIESKEKVETYSRIEVSENPTFDNVPSKAEAVVLDLVKDLDDMFDSKIQPKIESNISRYTDCRDKPISHSISLSADQMNTDPLRLNTSDIFENFKSCQLSTPTFDSSPILKPAHKSFSTSLNSPNCYSDQMNLDKYSFSEHTISKDPPNLNYTDILNTRCETSVIQSVPKTESNDQNSDLASICDKNTISDDLFMQDRELNDLNEANPNSSENFLLELFPPKSNETSHKDSPSSEKLKSEDFYFESDIKSKQVEAEKPSNALNQEDSTVSSFEIPEVNEQNEATEFNQDIFEPSLNENKESKLPQLLSFTSEQLFTDNFENKCSSPSSNNISENTTRDFSANEDITQEFDSLTKSENIEEETSTSIGIEDNYNKTESFKNDNDQSEKNFENLGLNLEDDFSSKPVDAESICSDTTDITVSDTKMDLEENQSTNNVEATLEEPAQEELSSQEEIHEPQIVEESSTVTKSKVERPRRGRRPKTRKYVEALSQKQETQVEVPVVPQSRTSSRRVRPTSSERVRRSLRSDTSEVIPIREIGRRHIPVEDIALSDNEEGKKENEDIIETGQNDETEKSADKLQTKVEEPKRRRGRRKKNSGESHLQQSSVKPDSKLEELESIKDHNRSKESRFRLSLSSDKEQKSTKDSSNAIDVYDFCEEEDEGAINSFKDIKDRLHDTSRNMELKHEKISEVSTEKERKVKEPKHEKLPDVPAEKDKKLKDQKHEKPIDTTLEKDKKSKESKHEKSLENIEKDKKSKEQKHEKFTDNIFEKDKKIEDNKKVTSAEEREIVVKEHHIDHPKISMTIRLNKKEGNDGTSPCIAEVVKTSEALNIEESKPEPPKIEKPPAKQESGTPEVPYSGPCKSTRKSTRLMNQGRSADLRSSVDVIIEEVVKGHSEPIQTRSSRRSKASRRSEDSLPIVSSENSEDTSDDKNKNEPVFFIHDNAVKDIHEDKKLTSIHSIETSSTSDAITLASDKTPNRISNLRSFRVARLAAAKLEGSKDTSSIGSNSNVGESDALKKDKSRRSSLDEKISSVQPKDKETSIPPKELKSPLICQPELKVEINRINIDITKEKITKQPEKISECKEESNSSSSPAVFLDPETGFLMPATSNESYSETLLQSSENKNTSSISLSDMSSIQLSKPLSVPEIHPNPSVIQENLKITDSLQHEKSSLVHNLRSRQHLNTNQITNLSSPTLPNPNTEVKPKIIVDTSTEHRKEKIIAVSTVGVLTATSSVVTSIPSIQTKPVTEMTSTTNLANNAQEKSVVIAAHVPAITMAHEIPVPDRERTDIIQSKVPQLPIQGYHVSNKVPTVVTTSTVAITTTVATTTTKCYTTAAVLPKTELPVAYSSVKTTSAPVHEHSSSTANQPISTVVHAPSEHSIVSIKQEPLIETPPLHPTPPTTSSHNVPEKNMYLKTANPRVVDVLAHVSAMQANANKANTFSGKHERSSKVHHSKNNSAFSDQTGFPLSAYETMLPSAHALVAATGNSGGVIAELLQNPQYLQQHKEYFTQTGQLQERIQVPLVRPSTPVASSIPPELAARLAPTPPHTPTPPVTSSNHPLQSSEIYTPHVNSPLMLRHQTPPSLIVPQHPGIALHQSDYNAYVHHQMIYANHPYAAINDLRAQEAQTRAAIGMNPRFPYTVTPPITSNFKQPSEPRHHMDSKSDPKSSELAKIMHETRGADEKSQHLGKPLRSKKEYSSSQKDKELKSLSTENRDHHDSNRHISTHEQKIPSTSAIAPHNLRQQQNTHYSSAIHQLSPRLNVSPHDRISDSPGIANLYAAGQARVPQITLAGQVEDRKSENVGSLPTHHYKNDVPDTIKPPVAHQAQPSTNLYALEAVHSRQQMLSAMQLGTAGSHIDGRTNNPSHSPTPHAYKKDSNQSLQLPLHISVNEKRLNSEHSKKYIHARTLSHQGASISPGPAGLGPARSPVPWPAVIQTHNSHSSLSQSSHPMLPNEPPASRRVGTHMSLSEVSPLVPPPAHRVPEQTPPRVSEPHNVGSFLQKYPVMWQGLLALKNDQAAVQMHFVTGNVGIARASLPPLIDGESAPVRVAQRMRLDTQQLEGVQKKLQLVDEHCVLLALPCGKDQLDVLQQSKNLNIGFINYLQSKQAAGIVNVATPGSQQPAYVIHIFPTCEFTNERVQAIAPDLPQIISDMSHLFIVIATV